MVGGVGGALAVIAIPLLDKLRIDDVVGAISAHLVAGVWGTLAVGLFGAGSLVTQIIGIAAVGAFMLVASTVVWLALKVTVGLRVSEEDEELGLDKSELGMEAYPEFRDRLAGRLNPELTCPNSSPGGHHLPGFFMLWPVSGK